MRVSLMQVMWSAGSSGNGISCQAFGIAVSHRPMFRSWGHRHLASAELAVAEGMARMALKVHATSMEDFAVARPSTNMLTNVDVSLQNETHKRKDLPFRRSDQTGVCRHPPSASARMMEGCRLLWWSGCWAVGLRGGLLNASVV